MIIINFLYRTSGIDKIRPSKVGIVTTTNNDNQQANIAAFKKNVTKLKELLLTL
jgi:hypothetical protein